MISTTRFVTMKSAKLLLKHSDNFQL